MSTNKCFLEFRFIHLAESIFISFHPQAHSYSAIRCSTYITRIQQQYQHKHIPAIDALPPPLHSISTIHHKREYELGVCVHGIQTFERALSNINKRNRGMEVLYPPVTDVCTQ